MFEITPSTRLRRSPYFDATVADGVTGFSTYNQMLMPTGYGDAEAEYWRLIDGVSQWDVAVQRQVEISGPDAGHLAQILSPRDLSSCAEGQGKYVGLCNHAGAIINDPILLKLEDTRFWMSIADSDIGLWARAIAAERRLDVEVAEPDVSPMAVQGPKAEDVITAIFGGWVRDLKAFWFREASIDGIPLMVARSGWSKQGGYELYLMDATRGVDLWNIVREAGRRWGIGPGNPNPCERIESGLLSWGGDTDDATNPFEVRMSRFVDLGVPDDVVGIVPLRNIHKQGARRHQLGIVLEGEEPMAPHWVWHDVHKDGRKIGDMTNGVWSWRLGRNIGFALVAREHKAGDIVVVIKDGARVSGKLTALPFI